MNISNPKALAIVQNQIGVCNETLAALRERWDKASDENRGEEMAKCISDIAATEAHRDSLLRLHARLSLGGDI